MDRRTCVRTVERLLLCVSSPPAPTRWHTRLSWLMRVCLAEGHYQQFLRHFYWQNRPFPGLGSWEKAFNYGGDAVLLDAGDDLVRAMRTSGCALATA